MNLKIKKTVVALALAVASSGLAPSAQANLQGTMESIFNSMTNFSQPGVYEGIQRGVISGGGASIHNRIVSANILNLQLPDWRAGCGGIDFFGGAFSFINAEQFVQLMRAIAANAAGYAFSLALTAMSPEISNEIKEMLTKVQEWVKLLSNSCEAAMVLVDAIPGMPGAGRHYQQFQQRLQGALTTVGESSDSYEAKTRTDGVASSDAQIKKQMGNIVYRSMVEQDSAKWFPGGDKRAIEEMMSLLGTVIITPGEKVDGKTNLNEQYKSPVLSFKDLFNGGNSLSVYRCNNYEDNPNNIEEGCTVVTPQANQTITSIQERFEEILVGPQYRTQRIVGGAVLKLANPKNGELNATEKNLLSNLSAFFGVPFRMLALNDPVVAAGFVQDCLPALTVVILHNMTIELGKAVREAVQQCSSSFAEKALTEIEKNERKIAAEVDELQKQYGTLTDVLRKYQVIRDTASDTQGEKGTSDSANVRIFRDRTVR